VFSLGAETLNLVTTSTKLLQFHPRTNVNWALCSVQRLSAVCQRQFCGHPVHQQLGHGPGLSEAKPKSAVAPRVCHSLKPVSAVCLVQLLRFSLTTVLAPLKSSPARNTYTHTHTASPTRINAYLSTGYTSKCPQQRWQCWQW